MDLDAQAKQADFAELVGATQQAVGKHVASGLLERGASYRVWLATYCEKLRTEASGRVQSNARERRDLAQAAESEAKAAMTMRQLWREDELILDLETVRQVMSEWSTIGKNEFLGAVDSIITAIESEHGITVDRDTLQRDVETALRAIGSYSLESPEVNS
ncbi:hypothetical protein [Spongiibacter marinus]|uniref:hypothetical protein n=1 Tax=Spongiibacter marinus TaxID=354246 RepID=UPI0019603B83|nr:hypothetical protein [Spongiibacter marinus]MBM7424966.1 hypothetical protein [Spongiibacter marinus]